jgi:hypothetical protein
MPEGYYVAGFAASKERDFAAAVEHYGACLELLCVAADACRVTSPGISAGDVSTLLKQARKAQKLQESRTEAAALVAAAAEQQLSRARRCANAARRTAKGVCGLRIPAWALFLAICGVACVVAVDANMGGDAWWPWAPVPEIVEPEPTWPEHAVAASRRGAAWLASLLHEGTMRDEQPGPPEPEPEPEPTCPEHAVAAFWRSVAWLASLLHQGTMRDEQPLEVLGI